MPDELTMRLDPDQRRLLDTEAAARGVASAIAASQLLSERLREIRRAQIYRESAEAGERYRAAVAAGEDVEHFDLDPLLEEQMPPYDGTVGGWRP